MSSLSAASALPVADGANGAGGGTRSPATPSRSLGSRPPKSRFLRLGFGASSPSASRKLRVLGGAIAVSLLLHGIAITGAAGWLAEQFRWDEPESGPPMHAVLLPPPPPVYQAPVKAPPPRPRPHPTVKAKPKAQPPPMFAAAPVAEPEPLPVDAASIVPDAAAPPASPPAEPAPAPTAAAAEPAPAVAAEPAVELANDPPPVPAAKVPKRIDLVGTLFVGDQNFMVGNGGFRLRHDGNRYEISVLGTPKGLARLLFAGEFNGVSRGAITPTGLQPSEYTEERGPGKRETAILDWETGVVRLGDNKVLPIEPPMFDRLSVILQFYYRPPEATELTMRVVGTRGIDTYVFRRLHNETIELPNRTVDAEVWRVNHDNGEPRIDLWMSPDYHYLPLRVRVYARQEFGGRFATLNIDEIRVED